MYELKRSKIIREEVKLGDEIITTELNLSEDSSKFIKLVRELEIIQINLEKKKELEQNLLKLGESIVQLTKITFGHNCDKVLKFYSNNKTHTDVRNEEVIINNTCINEMIFEILPFILYLKPQIEKFIEEKRKDLNKIIKGKRVE